MPSIVLLMSTSDRGKTTRISAHSTLRLLGLETIAPPEDGQASLSLLDATRVPRSCDFIPSHTSAMLFSDVRQDAPRLICSIAFGNNGRTSIEQLPRQQVENSHLHATRTPCAPYVRPRIRFGGSRKRSANVA